MVKFQNNADELVELLEADQTAVKAFSARFYQRQDDPAYAGAMAELKVAQKQRTQQMLAILDKIKQPTLSNIGMVAAQAISILALHDSRIVLQKVCDLFEELYRTDKSDTYYQAIPSMVDRLRIVDHRPQVFGTQWEFDSEGYPFSTPIEDIEQVDERRGEYGIEPFRWPKSLAIPLERQSWLERPLSEAVIRELSDEEYELNYRQYV